MSEAELHQIRMRLHQGERQKAARGELRLPLPAGLALRPSRRHRPQSRMRKCRPASSGLCQIPGAAKRPRRNALSAHERVAAAGSTGARAVSARGDLAGGRQRACARYSSQSGLCWSLRLRPSAKGSEPKPTRIAQGNRQGGNRGLGGLPASRSPWLHWLGGVHGQPAAIGGQRQPIRGGTRWRAAQGLGAAAGHCDLRPLWTSHELALLGAEWRLSSLLLPVDRDQQGSELCQEVRALPVDTLVERLLLDALAQDRIAIALEAVGQLEEESRQLERQWTLRRERARYEAERAWRQYDAVEPENRLVARSLERAWEEKLRAVEVIEQEHARWRSGEPLMIGAADRAKLQALGENLPQSGMLPPRRRPTGSAFYALSCVKLPSTRERSHGQVCLKIVWQTGATSEHRLQRRVRTYRDYIDLERLRRNG